MNNLTTRKIVLGMLMALVLAFGVQGIADAVTLTRGNGDLQDITVESQTFTITFTVGLTGNTAQPRTDEYKGIVFRPGWLYREYAVL